ncbi:hypothetical protein LXL04_021428 [Taraxacum kok-saghyz]
MAKIRSLVVGTNTQVLFWLDPWYDANTFKNRFPLLYGLESTKSCYVNERITDSNYTWKWKKELRGEAVLAEFLDLCSLLNNVRVTQVPTEFRFNLNKDDKYTVNTMRKCIDSMSNPKHGVLIDWSKIVPLNVRCFIWRTTLRKIPVSANLMSRGIMVQSDLCPLCEAEKETVDHLFTTCKTAEGVKEWIFKWCGIPSKETQNIEEYLDHAASWGNSPKKKARNNKVFNKVNTNPVNIADDIITQSFEWCKYRSKKIVTDIGSVSDSVSKPASNLDSVLNGFEYDVWVRTPTSDAVLRSPIYEEMSSSTSFVSNSSTILLSREDFVCRGKILNCGKSCKEDEGGCNSLIHRECDSPLGSETRRETNQGCRHYGENDDKSGTMRRFGRWPQKLN